MEAALPVHGLSDDRARAFRYVPRPEYRSLWSPRSGRPYVSNEPGLDPRLAQEIGLMAEAQSVVLVPLLAEGELIGLLGAADKPGGFTDGDVQILSTFAGPVATFLRGRQSFDRQRRQAARFERLAALVGDVAAVSGRARLLELTVRRVQRDLGYERVAFHAPRADGVLVTETEAGSAQAPPDPEALRWALRLAAPLEASRTEAATELAVPVRAGDHALGVLTISKARPGGFDEEETSLLSTLGGQLALALRRAESEAATEHLARQMATLYDLGLETAALQDLQALFARATEEAGRLIRADHSSVFRFDDREQVLRLFAVWAREPAASPEPRPAFRLGEGIAGRVGARPAAGARERGGAARGLRPPRESGGPDPVRPPHPLRSRAGRLGPLRRPQRHAAPGVAALHRRRPRVPDALRRPALDRGGELGGLRRGARAQRAAGARQRRAARVGGHALAGAHPRDGRAAHPGGVPALPRRDAGAGGGLLPRGRRRGPGPPRRGLGGRRDGEGPAGRALRERRHRVGAGGGGRLLPAGEGRRSALAVPILSGDEIAAILYVESGGGGPSTAGR